MVCTAYLRLESMLVRSVDAVPTLNTSLRSVPSDDDMVARAAVEEGETRANASRRVQILSTLTADYSLQLSPKSTIAA